MIPAVAQTLARLLAGGTSLITTEQIDFNHPGWRQNTGSGLNLYCYDLRASDPVSPSVRSGNTNNQGKRQGRSGNDRANWFDVSFLVSAWGDTALGEQHLLSEALMLLLPHPFITEDLLAPVLRGYGNLPMSVTTIHPTDTAALWSALGVPLRAALCVTVTTPFHLQNNGLQALSRQGDLTNPNYPNPVKASL
ncbi:MAG TPA: Pvc16 family protein [Candidatus Sericytochromatia bacterium]|jgi:hypothetical protein